MDGTPYELYYVREAALVWPAVQAIKDLDAIAITTQSLDKSLQIGKTLIQASGSDYVLKVSGSNGSLLTVSDVPNPAATPTVVISGSVFISGSLSALVKFFDIQHPENPNERLVYSALEGPENRIYTTGKLVNSNAILLPSYWKYLVYLESITVNITPFGEYNNLYVKDISEDCITVDSAENKPINCFYTVYAERKDIEKLNN